MTVGPAPLRRDATVLAGGAILSGLAAYAFLAVGTRILGPQDFAPISVLWSLWAMSAAAITFPLQLWIIRAVEAEEGEGGVWAAMPRLWLWTVAACVLAAGGAFAARELLFGQAHAAFIPMVALLPLGSVLMGLVRGMSASRSRYAGTAAAILGENVVRLLVLLVVREAGGSPGVGWALMSGFLIAVFFPAAFRHVRPPHGHPPTGTGLLGGLAVGNSTAQVVLTSAPVVLSVLGGRAREVTAVFTALAILRIPYMLSLGLANRITGPLTRMVLDRPGLLDRMERWLMPAAAAFAGLGGGLGVIVLPLVTEVVFGLELRLGAATTGMLTAGSILALANLLQMLVLVSRRHQVILVRSWLLALLVGAAALAAPLPLSGRIAVAFVVAEATAMVAMSGQWRSGPRALTDEGAFERPA